MPSARKEKSRRFHPHHRMKSVGFLCFRRVSIYKPDQDSPFHFLEKYLLSNIFFSARFPLSVFFRRLFFISRGIFQNSPDLYIHSLFEKKVCKKKAQACCNDSDKRIHRFGIRNKGKMSPLGKPKSTFIKQAHTGHAKHIKKE